MHHSTTAVCMSWDDLYYRTKFSTRVHHRGIVYDEELTPKNVHRQALYSEYDR